MSPGRAWLVAMTLLLPGGAGADVVKLPESQIILTVDGDYLDSTMPLYAELEQQAAGLKKNADPDQRSEIELRVQERISDILTAVPEVIDELARARQADLVLDRIVARRTGAAIAADITEDVERQLVARYGDRPLEIDP